MLTAKEKRFLKYWEEQREDGKIKYLVLYTIAWALIAFFIPLSLVVFVNILNFLRLYMIPLWAAILLSLMIGFVISLYTWGKNQAKEKMLLDKERNSDQ